MGIIWGFVSSAFTSASHEGGYVDPKQDCMLLLTEKKMSLKILAKASNFFLQYFANLILSQYKERKKMSMGQSVFTLHVTLPLIHHRYGEMDTDLSFLIVGGT